MSNSILDLNLCLFILIQVFLRFLDISHALLQISLLVLHRSMAARVRHKVIEMTRAAIIMGAAQDERVKLKLKQEHNQLEQADQGWKLLWGFVDRALVGMKCFCGTSHTISPPPTTTRMHLGYHT